MTSGVGVVTSQAFSLITPCIAPIEIIPIDDNADAMKRESVTRDKL